MALTLPVLPPTPPSTRPDCRPRPNRPVIREGGCVEHGNRYPQLPTGNWPRILSMVGKDVPGRDPMTRPDPEGDEEPSLRAPTLPTTSSRRRSAHLFHPRAESRALGGVGTLRRMRSSPGRVVLLNGPSSSGKSSIGAAMLPLLDDPWFFVPVDAISGMRSTVHRRDLDEREVAEMLRRTRLGYHRAVAALAFADNDVIMDYPLSEPWRLADLVEVLAGVDVTLVHVRTDPAELQRRERARGDRPAGLATRQRVFDHAVCDIEVDTTHHPAAACAATIVQQIASITAPKAFDRLRARGMSG